MKTPNPAFSLCVYCGSRLGDDPGFAATAKEVGHWLANEGAQLVYGGGNNGLMGVIAQSAQEKGGRVVGVIPESMVVREWARKECDELIVVQSMHDRKRVMAERADAFLVLPGGIGTFEEFFETWTWKQLGYHNKPIGLLNQNGYYDDLVSFVKSTLNKKFMVDHQLGLIEINADTKPLLHELKRQTLKNLSENLGTHLENI
jgi:uncharacterized protein (TIGR00730 family)